MITVFFLVNNGCDCIKQRARFKGSEMKSIEHFDS